MTQPLDQISSESHRGAAEDRPPLVSVIIPAYNAGEYLADALESVQRQTLEDFEVIVVDDGSKDQTSAIANSFVARDRRFRLIRRETPSGKPACARNIALREARGEYIALLDSDDVALPGRLGSSVAAMRSAGASLLFADFRKFRHGGGEHFPEAHLESLQFVERAEPYLERVDAHVYRCKPGFIAFTLTDMMAVNTPTFCASRRDLLASGVFDENLVGGEDLDLFYRMMAEYTTVYLDQVQTLLRVHATSLTATQTERCIVDAIHVRRHHFVRARSRMNPDEVRRARAAIAESLFDLAYGRWSSGRGRDARAALRESWRAEPRWRTVIAYVKAWVPRPIASRLAPILRSRTA